MSNGLNPEAQQERQDHLPRAVPGPERRHAGEGVRPRADARRFKTETEHAQDHGAWSDPRAGKTTLRSYGDAHLAAQTFDETTREAVALRLRLHVYPQLGDYALAALRHSVVQAWARGLQQQLAPSYVRVVFANLSAILQAAVDDGAIGRNPRRAASVKPPAPDRRKVLPWSAERVAAVAAARAPAGRVLRLARVGRAAAGRPPGGLASGGGHPAVARAGRAEPRP